MRQKVSVATYLTFSLAKTKHALGIRMPPFSFGDSDMTDQRKGSDAEPTTHFGFKNVPESQKAEKVAEVFHSVAAKYDLMNDVLSGGMHRLWKRFTIELSGVRTGNRVLDIAGGTGDLAAKFSKLVGPTGQVVLADINGSMLKVGRDRLLDKGVAGNIEFVQADAEKLPFPDNHFDCVTIAFGLRNVTHKEDALRSMLRVLKPGGRLLVDAPASFANCLLIPALVELHRGFRDEVEHRRGINRYAQRSVRCGVDFCRRQTAEIAEAIAEATTDRDHQFDVAQAVLVADQIRAALGQALQQRRDRLVHRRAVREG